VRPLLPSLVLLLTLAVATFAPSLARAQVRPDPAACSAVQSQLAECTRASRAAEQEASSCKQELESTATRAQGSAEASSACQRERDRIQSKLDASSSGLSNATIWMGQLAAYESGETDQLPRPRGGGALVDRAMQRMSGDGGRRVFHRRLLVEALELVAPRAWEQIRKGGATAIDTWFASTAPIDPDVIAEAQHAHGAQPGPAGPPLTAALHLVRAFQVAGGCAMPGPDARECGRALQLQRMLETTSSLVLRRRVQEIWATDCSAINAGAIMPWIEDFPSAQLGGAGEPWTEIAESAHAKLFACYLDDATNHVPYGTWLKNTLPPPSALTAARLRRVDAIRSHWSEASPEAACARAVRAMQTFVVPPTCAVPLGDFREALRGWASEGAKRDDVNVALGMCAQFAQLLWEGKAASIDQSDRPVLRASAVTRRDGRGEGSAADPDVAPPRALRRTPRHRGLVPRRSRGALGDGTRVRRGNGRSALPRGADHLEADRTRAFRRRAGRRPVGRAHREGQTRM
jgi:hypothetical protein